MSMSLEIIKQLEHQRAYVKKKRQTYEDVWADIMDHCAPDLKGYLNIDQKDDGTKKDDVIYDDDPKENCMKCASGIWASNSSPSRPWMSRKMKIKKLNEISEVREWTDTVTEIDYDNLRESNFYPSMFNIYWQMVAVGTAAMIIDPDYDTIYNCIPLNVGEYWLGVNGKNQIDTLFREFKLMVSEMKDVFDEENIPDKLLKTITEGNPMGEECTIIHVIAPDKHKIAPFKKPYVSAYYLVAQHEGKFLQVKGYSRKPFAASPWFRLHGETYGKLNPGRNMLSNCKQLQSMVYDYCKAVQMVIDPPTQGSSDLVENNEISSIPGGHTVINPMQPGEKLEALFEIRPDIAAQWQSIQDKKQQIASGFLIDLFMAMSMRMDKDMTAQEVREISGEKMLALAPALDNMQQLLSDILDIIFDYSIAAGVYPPPPEEIQGEEIKVDYVSALAQAQKMVDLSRIDQVLMYVERIAQYYPDILHKVDFFQLIDEVNEKVVAPAAIVKDDETVDKILQQIAQKAQMQEMAQMATVAADVGGKMANMPMDQDNALTRMTGVKESA
jgi:hypothetical protein